MDEFIDTGQDAAGLTPRSLAVVALPILALLALGLAASIFFRPDATEAPDRIAHDPLLAEGQRLYLDRCLTCHGDHGRGDGPIARSIQGPPPGDLTDDIWKHGDSPDRVLAVIRDGVIGTAMPAWSGPLTDDQARAAAAYVYVLAGRPVPDKLRVTN